ncbi:MAG: hypothetical protein J2P21_25305 [Chloracidobacterium sp.]|nr:hypothetical protein [Chloracidobacterium sp.]
MPSRHFGMRRAQSESRYFSKAVSLSDSMSPRRNNLLAPRLLGELTVFYGARHPSCAKAVVEDIEAESQL